MRYRANPEGRKLSAVEKNILKYRAFEMVLMLFYAEHLRREIISAVKSKDRWKARFDDGATTQRITASTKDKFKVALAALVSDRIFEKNEANEIVSLVDFRNTIAHRIHELTMDIGRDDFVKRAAKFNKSKYDFDALKKIRHFENELDKRTRDSIREISFDDFYFDAADKTYTDELKRLRQKIEPKLLARKQANTLLRSEMDLTGTELVETLAPDFPANFSSNGTLTKRGVEICFRLFDMDKSARAVAHLMHLSPDSVRKRRNQWHKLGGRNRTRSPIRPLNLTRRHQRR